MDFLNSALYRHWFADQVLALDASELTRSNDLGTAASISAATRILSAASRLSSFSDATLHCIASVPQENQIAWKEMEEINVGPVVDAANRCLDELTIVKPDSVSTKCNHQALLGNAVILLKQPGLLYEEFLSWAQRASPPGQARADEPFWTREAWAMVATAMTGADRCNHANACLAVFRDADPRQLAYRRLAAVCDLYDTVITAAHPHAVPHAWRRLCTALLSSLFCTPVIVTTAGGIRTGTSLPVMVSLTDRKENKTGRRRVCFYGGPRNPCVSPVSPEGFHHFERGALAWNTDWARSFELGLKFAKKLWATQFSRLDDQERLRKVLDKCLWVDLSFANRIASATYGKESYVLEGLSATAYWLQAALGMLLPGAAVPDGVATGIVRENDGELILEFVEDIPAKLKYAVGAGLIARMILPADDKTRAAIENFGADAEVRVSLLERNLCSSARVAADAMQSNGWRRANFLATPEVRFGFSSMLQRLFDLENGHKEAAPRNNEDTLRDGDHTDPDAAKPGHKKVRPLTAYDLEKLGHVRRWLVSDKPGHRIKYVRRSELDEMMLGKTLAWIDEGVRSGTRPREAVEAVKTPLERRAAPGLGVLCIRTREGESDMRFWSNVFRMLDVNPSLWRQFQWASCERAAEILAMVLNNFNADPAISSAPPPDLFVILDDADLTRKPLTRVFPERFAGRLHQLFRPARNLGPNTLARQLSSLSHREAWLYETRIVIVQPDDVVETEAEGDSDTNEAPVTERGEALCRTDGRMDFDRMRVFRYGFSIHSAYAVLNHGRTTPLEWSSVRKQMHVWRSDGKLRYHRGEYYIEERLRVAEATLRRLHDPDLHLAAALSLAPMLEPARALNAINRDRAFAPEPFGEALWHCHRALRSPKGPTNHRARRFFAALGYLQPNPAWDTWRILSSDNRTYAPDAWDLARELIGNEEKQNNGPAHPYGYANAMSTLANWTTADSFDPVWAYERALELCDKATAQCFHDAHLNDAGVRFYSVFAFFLIRLLQTTAKKDGGMWESLNSAAHERLEKIESHLFRSVDLLLRNWDTADSRFFPFDHGWLGAKWTDERRSLGARFNLTLIACRIEERAVPHSWIEMLNLLQPYKEGITVTDVRAVARLWSRIPVKDRRQLGFGIATRFHGPARERRHTALWNIVCWLAVRNRAGNLIIDGDDRESICDLANTFFHQADWIYLTRFCLNARNPLHLQAIATAAEITDAIPVGKQLPILAVKDLPVVRTAAVEKLSRVKNAQSQLSPESTEIVQRLLSRRELARSS